MKKKIRRRVLKDLLLSLFFFAFPVLILWAIIDTLIATPQENFNLFSLLIYIGFLTIAILLGRKMLMGIYNTIFKPTVITIDDKYFTVLPTLSFKERQIPLQDIKRIDTFYALSNHIIFVIDENSSFQNRASRFQKWKHGLNTDEVNYTVFSTNELDYDADTLINEVNELRRKAQFAH